MHTNEQTPIAVIGQGYVGLPLAESAIVAGHTVIGYDIDEDKIDSLRFGISPIQDVTHADVSAINATGRYQPTDRPDTLALCNTYIVTVPTPLLDSRPDLAYVLAAARTIGPHLRDGDLVVLESTVAPGTTDGAFHTELARTAPIGARFHVAFSPERIDPGNRTWTFRTTPKLVGARTDPARDRAVAFYRTICNTVVPCATAEIAEMAKLLENTYRYVNIALINELGRHATTMGIPIWDVITAAATKPYGFQAFHPGPGVGGHCLPIDPMYLSDEVERHTGRPFALVDLADQVNISQPAYVIDRAAALLNDDAKAVNGSIVLVLGIAYKRGTSDMRETPAMTIIGRLLQLGAHVIVADPYANLDGIPAVKIVDHRDGAITAAANADLVILVTDHDEFDYDQIGAAARRVLDTRNRFTPAGHITRL